MNLYLRPVEREDLNKILDWRNEPGVRESSTTQHIISMAEHEKYWNMFLSNEKNLAYIVVKGRVDIGVLKLKYQDEYSSEVDIFLSQDYQGRGLGKLVLAMSKEEALKNGIKKLTAKIKPDNIASIKAFEKCGFRKKTVYYEAEIK